MTVMGNSKAFGCILCAAALLFHGCSVGVYAPYPSPIPFVNRQQAVSVAAGIPLPVAVAGAAGFVLGSGIGAYGASLLNAVVLQKLFGLVLPAVALHMLTGRPSVP